ncbi:MAG: cytochrome c [Deltaproteobacteria bacterium]|nr:cytochrome c [Deltaproteobacteria bacterium]
MKTQAARCGGGSGALLALVGAALCGAILYGSDRPLDGDPVHGRVLYLERCASCHGKEAQGSGKAPRLTEGGLVNSLSDEIFLEMLVGGAGGKKLHPGLQKGFANTLDAWDVIGYLRGHVPYVGDMFPAADRYIVKQYGIDKNAKERLAKSLGRDVSEAEAKALVFTLFNTKSGQPLRLVPQDPRRLDELKRPMKTGYVVFMPFEKPAGGKVQLAIALEPAFLRIVSLYAVDAKGAEERDLNKLLSRFRDKGDRKLSGTAKALLAVGGGGKDVKALEKSLTDIYLRALEIVTSYESEERERSWADEDVQLTDPSKDEVESNIDIK